MKPRFGDSYFVVSLLCATTVGAIYVTRARAASPTLSATMPTTLMDSLDALGVVQRLGDSRAPVVISEITDYACPACASAHKTLWRDVSAAAQRGDIRFASYDIPIKPNAIIASVLMACVRVAQPTAFWGLRHEVFVHQLGWSHDYAPEDALIRLGRAVGLDSTTTRNCIAARRDSLAKVYEHVVSLARGSVPFTPMWAVNGVLVSWDSVTSTIRHARTAEGARAGDLRRADLAAQR